jgi:hypothetical protein
VIPLLVEAVVQTPAGRRVGRAVELQRPYETQLASAAIAARKAVPVAAVDRRLICTATRTVAGVIPATSQVGHSHAATTAVYMSVSDDFKDRLIRAAIDEQLLQLGGR